MRYEIKLSIICIVLCFCFISIYVYVSKVHEYTYYIYQIGIYKDEINKDNKLNELSDLGYMGYSYAYNDQFYVLSMITDNKNEIKKHASQLNGVIKEHKSMEEKSAEDILIALEKGELYD